MRLCKVVATGKALVIVKPRAVRRPRTLSVADQKQLQFAYTVLGQGGQCRNEKPFTDVRAAVRLNS
jgi:hypothetical protein